MNLIAKPSKENIKTYVPIGLSLVSLSILDVFVNAFFNLFSGVARVLRKTSCQVLMVTV